MKKVVAQILKLKAQLLQKTKQKKAIIANNMDSTVLIDAELLLETTDSIVKLIQAKLFKDELDKLKQKEKSLSEASACVPLIHL